MLFRNYKCIETNEDGEVLSKDTSIITLKADVDASKVEESLGVSLVPLGEPFEVDVSETEFRQFNSHKCDKFSGIF